MAPGGTPAAGDTAITVGNSDTLATVAASIASAINNADLGVIGSVSSASGPVQVMLPRSEDRLGPRPPPLTFSDGQSNLTGGQSAGLYTLQIRLQQQVQFPGSVVQYANINYSTTGVQVIGQPNLSPLLGESESNTANNSFATAQDLGNLLTSNQATVAVGGTLNSASQVDWYKLTINYDLIQRISGASADLSWPTMFDMDYADGLTRPDSTMGIYDSSGNLILVGRNSQVADDQPTPGQGSDTQNLAAGSEGTLDPFIGTQQMPAGPSRTYYIAVSSAAQLPQTLDQTFNSAATNSLTRLEPIDSVSRVVEDHFTVDPILPAATTTESSGTSGAANSIFGTSAKAVDSASHVIPYTLGNVVLFVTGPKNGTNELYTTNASTGSAGFSTQQGLTALNFADLAMRNDGELYGLSNAPTGVAATDANTGLYTQISSANASTVSSSPDGIITYQQSPTTPFNADGSVNFVVENTGLQYTATAFNQSDPTNRTFYAVANTTAGVNGYSGQTNNLLFEFNATTGQVMNVAPAPKFVTNAAFGALQIGSGINAAVATTASDPTSDIDPLLPAGSPHTTFTINGGAGPVTFEFVSGPAATVPATGGQNVINGQSFTISGRTYVYNEGIVATVDPASTGASFEDKQLRVTSALASQRTISSLERAFWGRSRRQTQETLESKFPRPPRPQVSLRPSPARSPQGW